MSDWVDDPVLAGDPGNFAALVASGEWLKHVVYVQLPDGWTS